MGISSRTGTKITSKAITKVNFMTRNKIKNQPFINLSSCISKSENLYTARKTKVTNCHRIQSNKCNFNWCQKYE